MRQRGARTGKAGAQELFIPFEGGKGHLTHLETDDDEGRRRGDAAYIAAGSHDGFRDGNTQHDEDDGKEEAHEGRGHEFPGDILPCHGRAGACILDDEESS